MTNLPYCTYRTTHPSGFIYEGKGVTAKVLDGSYKGSGIRFKLATTYPGFELDTWTTVVLETFATEEEAYTAEALLVPLESLNNPYRLNMTEGGRRGKYRNHSTLYKKHTSAKKAESRAHRTAAARNKKLKAAKEIKELKSQLKDKNARN